MDERERIRSALCGDREEFRLIMSEYTPAALALAVNVLGNRQDAEDALQEAFLQVYRHRHGFDARLSFKSWLYAILYHRCVDILRKRRRAFRLFEKIKEGPAQKMSLKADPAPVEPAVHAGVLRCLSAKERTALALWASEGCTSQEIGRIMGCSASTARVHLFQARKKIKSLLEGSHVGVSRL